MRSLFWITILFALGVGLALVARYNNGNVVLLVPPYRIDLSLNLAVVLIAAAFVLLYFLIRIIDGTFGFPDRVRAFRERSREAAAREGLRASQLAYFEGRFSRAERSARDAQAVAGYAGVAALVAARASHKLREFGRRGDWLRVAELDPSVRTARLMTQAEMLLEERRAEEANALVRLLHASGARHVASIRLALNAAQQLEQWDEVLRLVRQLAKRDAIHPALAARTKAIAYRALSARRRGDLPGLKAFWSTVPSEDRSLVDVAEPIAQAFALLGQHDLAVQIIEEALARNWDERLVRAYAEIGGATTRLTQIQRAERWLAQYPQEASLLVTLGLLCAAEGLWGKAADYLERSVRVQVQPRALSALSWLAEQNGDSARADALYRQAAIEVVDAVPDIVPVE
ncbi:heme biosynthesis protein HemY [soil metagenome]